MSKHHTPPPSMTFAGMEEHVTAQDAAAGAYQAEELTAKMREPLKDISARAGAMERDAPLFYGRVDPLLFEAFDPADSHPPQLLPHHD